MTTDESPGNNETFKSIASEASGHAGDSVERGLGLVDSMLQKGAAGTYDANAWVQDMSRLYVGAIRDTARMGSIWMKWAAALADIDVPDPGSSSPQSEKGST